MIQFAKKREHVYYWFVLPAIILFITFIIIPVASSVNLSMTNFDGINPDYDYVGLTNFKIILTNERFHNALKNSIIYGVAFTILANVASMGLALIVDNIIKGKNFFRSMFYLPVLISGVIAGFIWSIMFNYSFGIINSIITSLGFTGKEIDFLGMMPNAIIAIVFVMVWQRGGYYMIIYLAGLQGIPHELIESAQIDGASGIQRFRHITFPLLSGSFTVNMTLALIYGFKVFDQIAVMTDGGPGFATESITYLIYKVAFAELKQGYGTALALVLFAVVVLVALIQVGLLRRREVQL